MRVYTYSEARQRLASLLDQARREGQVQIRRRDGQLFILRVAEAPGSPLDVPAVKARLRRGDLEAIIREGRASGDRFAKRTHRKKPSERSGKRSTAAKPGGGARRGGAHG